MGLITIYLGTQSLAEKETQSLELLNGDNNHEVKALNAQQIQTVDLVAAEGRKHYSKGQGHYGKYGGHHGGGKHGKHSHGQYSGGYKHGAKNYKKNHKHGGHHDYGKGGHNWGKWGLF